MEFVPIRSIEVSTWEGGAQSFLAAVVFICAALSRLPSCFRNGTLALALACGTGCLGSIARVAYCLGIESSLLWWAGTLFMDCFQAYAILLCFSNLAGRQQQEVIGAVMTWQVASSLVWFSMGWVTLPIGRMLAIMLPAMAFIIGLPLARTSETPAPLPSDVNTQPRCQTPWRQLVIIVLVIADIYGLIALSPFDTDPVSHLGSLLTPCLVLALFVLNPRVPRLSFLYRCSIALLALSSTLAIAESEPASVGAAFASACAYSTFVVFYCTLLASECSRNAVSARRLFGLALSCEYLGAAFGNLIGTIGTLCDLPRALPISALLALLVFAFVFLAFDEDYGTAWKTRRAPLENWRLADYYRSLPETCLAAVRQYGISKREEDVLMLLMQRKSAPDIAAELSISEATVRSHTQHIYRKLGVHGRAEALELLGYPSQNDEERTAS